MLNWKWNVDNWNQNVANINIIHTATSQKTKCNSMLFTVFLIQTTILATVVKFCLWVSQVRKCVYRQ